VLVIDDNRLVRDGLASLLDGQSDMKVVGAAGDTVSGLRKLQQLSPNVVLVDAALDNGDGPRYVASIRQAAPTVRVLVMDLLASTEEVIEFAQGGANGFIMKDATLEDLVSTIRSVALGADVVPPALSGTLLSHIARQAVVRRTPGVAELVRMTKREREVMDLIAEGLSNKEMAQRLGIATYTIKSHVHNILEKLALHSRLQIAALTLKTQGSPDSKP
jgi:DNA-binding NarL/FixJ family response regulator